MSDLGTDAARGMQAKSLLENSLLSESFDKLEQSYIAAWRTTNVSDVTGREKLFLAINVIGKVKDHLQSIVNNGTLAEAELAAIAKTEQRKTR